jgi:hypothetical protein
VDALCINQKDPEEKKVQIGLMRRVYQQAEKVIAYLPLPLADQTNIGELVPQILQASQLCMQARDRMRTEGPGQYTGKFNSVADSGTRTMTRDESETMSLALAKASKEQVFLEDFGLPLEDSPLWGSWRRLFASPYFRRIWILQEISLAKNLVLWFGNGGTDRVLDLIVAHQLLDEYSGALNMRYMASPRQLSDQQIEISLTDALAGSHSASRMFVERLGAQNGTSSQGRLIEKLASMASFQATDPRDKIYALLGLAPDGEAFVPHVSYSDSTEQVFFNFVKLFIRRGEGIDVLMQAGMRDNADRWPSFVPRWDDLGRAVGAARSPGKCPTRMQVSEKDRTLHVRGTILGDVKTLNKSVFEKLSLTTDGVSHMKFIGTLVSGFRMAFETTRTGNPEDIFEQLFQVIVQPEELRTASKPQDDEATRPHGYPDLDATNPEASSGSRPEHDDEESEISVMRTGFHEFLNHLIRISSALPALREGSPQILAHDKPAEWHALIKRAMNTTAHRLLCVTGSRHVGVAPRYTEVGDQVATFEGCDVHFVLRRVPDTRADARRKGRNTTVLGRLFSSKGKEMAEKAGERYRLVGPAYFPGIESIGGSTARHVNITIV